MATLSIPFPDGTKKLALRGNRITIGRLPDNLIQVRDLTISGRHAELVLEGDHYRIRDLQSTNGVFVDGRQVEDFHLHEGCKLRLGTLECDFLAEEAAEAEAERVPTHIEMRTLKQANAELKTQFEALREQLEKMREARATGLAEKEGLVSLEKDDQLAAEVATLQAAQAEQRTQMEALRTQLAVVGRERDNLQRAYDDARGSLEQARPTKPALDGEFSADGEKSQTIPLTIASVAATGGIPAPAAPIVDRPLPAPTAPLSRPKAPTVPFAPPVAAAPAAAGTAAPKPPLRATAPARLAPNAPTPAPAVGGVRAAGTATALPRPPGSLTGSTPVRRPPSAVQPQPQKPLAAQPAAAGRGPRGTQKLED